MKTSYIKGETITIKVADGGYTSVIVSYGNTAVTAVKRDGEFVAVLDTEKLDTGKNRYAVLATKDGERTAIDSGSFLVLAIKSKYREVVEAIDKALQGVATNGKYSVSVGEISLTDKTFDEMVKALQFYTAKAEEEEDGDTSLGKVGTIQMEFA